MIEAVIVAQKGVRRRGEKDWEFIERAVASLSSANDLNLHTPLFRTALSLLFHFPFFFSLNKQERNTRKLEEGK
ncbi:unnamed protein product [Cuscuta campestris]|uniref:Uncharacterized protein n=1 Tax=Cuscuta campestris TaxID=132261 RepID=A0A484KU33_9ASTE|nr:unnamed protein product [Cuscuta campestris]